jgi:hypothetical protein
MEVVVHVVSNQDRASYMGDDGSSFDTREQMYERPSGDDVVERDE